MKRAHPFLLGFLVLSSVVCAAPTLDIAAELQRWNQGNPGGIAVAWVDAEGFKFYQAGQFSSHDSRSITPDTRFEIGSVTKVFTGLLLAECERQGLVKREDSAAKYLLPAKDPQQNALSKITLVSLATHSSGLPRLPSNMTTAAAADPYASYTREMLVEALCQDGAKATPGAGTTYSNFGAGVLGESLAAALGTSYEAALEQMVLKPLQLDATCVAIPGTKPADLLAPGHAKGVPVSNWTFAAMAPAGALRSTARDMAKFLSAYLQFADTPLKASLTESVKPLRAEPEVSGRIGLHWLIVGEGAKEVVWHNGMTGGYASFVGFSPASHKGIVILTNHARNVDDLGFLLLTGSRPMSSVTPVTNAVDYVGRYPLVQGFCLDVTETKGSLFVQATGQSRLPLHEEGADLFSIVGVPAQLSFERNAETRVIAVVLHQNGQTPRGLREALPAPIVRKEISLSEETLEPYLGNYVIQPGAEFTVTLKNGSLSVRLGHQDSFPVFATAKDEFFYKAVDAQLSFKRDEAGKVTELTLHQNGQHIVARKRE